MGENAKSNNGDYPSLRPFSEQLVHQHPLSRRGPADLATRKTQTKRENIKNATMIVRSERVISDFLALM